MAIKTQLRLAQLTGSVADLRPASVAAGVAAASATHADLEDVLQYYAQAISNIHGNIEFGSQEPGQFNQDIKPDTGATRTIGVYDLATWGQSSSVWSLKATLNTATNSNVDSSTTELNFSSGPGSSLSVGDYIIIDSGGGQIYYYEVQSPATPSTSPVQVSFDSSKSSGSSAISIAATYHLTASQASANTDTVTSFNRAVVNNIVSPSALRLDSRGSGTLTLNSAGTLDVDAASNIDIDASTAVAIDAGGQMDLFSAQAMSLSGSAVTLSGSVGLLGLHGAGVDITDDSSNGIGLKSSAGGLFLSGGLGLSLMADGDHNGANGGVPFSLQGEGTSFISNFSADASVLGALNTLYSANVDTAQTKIVKLLTGSWDVGHPAGLPVGSSDDDVTVHGTFAAVDTLVSPHEVDVFVNGQLMLSGTATGAAVADYFVSDSNAITFKFDLVADDVVIVQDKR